MGLTKSERIEYLRIADGKIRKRTTEDDKDAVKRHDSINDKDLYELVYKSCEGYLREIRVQTHEEYGTSYSMILYDPETGTKYSLQMGEETRYFQSLVMLMPNLDLSKPMEVRPYSWVADGRRNIGLSIRQDGKKVENYYKDFDEDSKRSRSRHGLEKFNFSKVKNDKEERKILQMKLLKWLKSELKPQLIRLQEHVEANPLPEPPQREESGLKPDEDSQSSTAQRRARARKEARQEEEQQQDDSSTPRGKKGKKERDLPY